MAKQSDTVQADDKWKKFSEAQAEQTNDDSGTSKPEQPAQAPRAEGHESSSDDVFAEGETAPQDQANADAEIPSAAGETEALASLENKIKSLEMKLAAAEDQVVRGQAEMENTRRRAERDVSNAHRYGNDKLVNALLPVVDSLARGLEGVDSNDEKMKPVAEGLTLTAEMLEKVLIQFGLEVVAPAAGDSFNPECHEAMSMIPKPGAEKNTIVEVLQKGYLLNGRVVRAAMVIVAQ